MLPLLIGGGAVVIGIGTLAKFAWDYFSGKEVLFLLHGESGAGKSTVVSSLSGKQHETDTMEHEEINIPKEPNVDFSAIVMIDVGGRDIHKAENEEVREKFFKKKALKCFLYVFNAKDVDNQEKIQHGIEVYRDICKKKEVLFLAIGTRADELENGKNRELEKKIRQELNVRSFVIDARKQNEVSEVFSEILKLIQEKYQ